MRCVRQAALDAFRNSFALSTNASLTTILPMKELQIRVSAFEEIFMKRPDLPNLEDIEDEEFEKENEDTDDGEFDDNDRIAEPEKFFTISLPVSDFGGYSRLRRAEAAELAVLIRLYAAAALKQRFVHVEDTEILADNQTVIRLSEFARCVELTPRVVQSALTSLSERYRIRLETVEKGSRLICGSRQGVHYLVTIHSPHETQFCPSTLRQRPRSQTSPGNA